MSTADLPRHRRDRLRRRPARAAAARRRAPRPRARPAPRTSSATSRGSADVEIVAGDAGDPADADRRDGRGRRRVLPAALDPGGPAASRTPSGAWRQRFADAARDEQAAPHRLPRRPRSPDPRGGACPRTCARASRWAQVLRELGRPDGRAARGGHHRLRLGELRDAALPHRAAAGHDHAAVGAPADAADRDPRRPALPRGGGVACPPTSAGRSRSAVRRCSPTRT